MKLFKTKFYLTIIASFLLLSCGSSEGGGEVIIDNSIIPTNLTIAVAVVGVSKANPSGDGSGEIKLTVSAKDAIRYKVKFGDGNETESTSGNIDYTYTNVGSNKYTIEVIAFSKTDDFVSDFIQQEVFVSVNGLKLVWSDNFDSDGAPDPTKWTYDLGRGSNGWGNNESQFYTKRTENVTISNGTLKIKAKKENFSGANYTSARLKTQGLYNFTYGRVEIRAKLPSTKGTWPALWTLGSNINSVSWPNCGEIDIMEHIGNELGRVQSATHTPSSFANTQNKGATFSNSTSTAFHIYELRWTEEKLEFLFDGELYYTYNPSVKNSSTWPFNSSQFLIMNVAIGGTLGGNIDASFTEDVMEIDYIKVYQ
ncbi:glycoside hydrolase family 16 protein [Polaribacter haliotis]|uniref:Glycoside hydrolase family 16 protein n=1 Tax=Polaribacter haliotis TaxID=1888915 RepID=A0A7L8AFU6_9FLAO|nr:glycoside hydrolase family 16 protein [Polaribacter haliotis]QOD60885.1 glycoside hydrolase family 16 protein [Polaribacter haliotis]